MKKLFLVGIFTTLALSVAGELVRLPFGPANGVLPNDLLLAVLTGGWIIYKVTADRIWPKTILWSPFLLFISLAALSLLNALHWLSPGEVAQSSLYLIRFIEYGALTFVTLDVTQNNPTWHRRLKQGLILAAVMIAIGGFVQLQIKPDFRDFEQLGWDPHIGRLLSTWFDPNFVGGLFAFTLSVIGGLLLGQHGTTNAKQSLAAIVGLTTSAGLLLYALLLTFSRSAYLAFLFGMGTLGLLRSRKLLIVLFVACFLLVSISERAEERVVNLYHTAQSLIGVGAELPDATARLRLDSWKGAWIIIQDHPFAGIGYNTYRYAQNRYGFLDDLTKHAGTGSDSSLLTIWATTGSLGLAAYLWFIGAILWITFKTRKNGLSLGTFAGTISLLIHSLFVNSLLYSPLLVLFYTTLGLTLTELPCHSTTYLKTQRRKLSTLK